MKTLKNVIVAGYPKSGNTWLSRLVAELLDCPVSGFWQYDEHPEIAIEGGDRESNYRVYKSHHQHHELSDNPDVYKIIYIVRDPRDIVMSGMHYFSLTKFKQFAAIERYIIRSDSRILKLIDRLLFITSRRSKKMTDVILNGDCASRWLEAPWGKHVSEYLNFRQDVLVVRYEDLLLDPIKASQKILCYIGFDGKKKEEIERAVHVQSFENKKKNFQQKGDSDNLRFMREGGSLKWKGVLSKTNVEKINRAFKNNLCDLGYDV